LPAMHIAQYQLEGRTKEAAGTPPGAPLLPGGPAADTAALVRIGREKFPAEADAGPGPPPAAALEADDAAAIGGAACGGFGVSHMAQVSEAATFVYVHTSQDQSTAATVTAAAAATPADALGEPEGARPGILPTPPAAGRAPDPGGPNGFKLSPALLPPAVGPSSTGSSPASSRPTPYTASLAMRLVPPAVPPIPLTRPKPPDVPASGDGPVRARFDAFAAAALLEGDSVLAAAERDPEAALDAAALAEDEDPGAASPLLESLAFTAAAYSVYDSAAATRLAASPPARSHMSSTAFSSVVLNAFGSAVKAGGAGGISCAGGGASD